MNNGKIRLELELDLDAILTSEEYGITLKDTLIDIVKQEIKDQVHKLARANMKKFVASYLGGRVRIDKDEDGNDCVLIPLLLGEIKGE